MSDDVIIHWRKGSLATHGPVCGAVSQDTSDAKWMANCPECRRIMKEEKDVKPAVLSDEFRKAADIEAATDIRAGKALLGADVKPATNEEIQRAKERCNGWLQVMSTAEETKRLLARLDVEQQRAEVAEKDCTGLATAVACFLNCPSNEAANAELALRLARTLKPIDGRSSTDFRRVLRATYVTIPTMMNCEHQRQGWCLNCVADLRQLARAAEERHQDEKASLIKTINDLRQQLEQVTEERDGLRQRVADLETAIESIREAFWGVVNNDDDGSEE